MVKLSFSLFGRSSMLKASRSSPSLCTGTPNETNEDAHVLFEAVRQGHLPMIRRRLSGGERAQLRSGDVFVWEEAPHKGGLERWTDGRKWYVSCCPPRLLFSSPLANSKREPDESERPTAVMCETDEVVSHICRWASCGV